MIKAVIIEDEFNAREALNKMLPHVAKSIEVLGFSGHIKEAIKLIENQKPDIVFLDIELEDGTGFDVLNGIVNPGFKIIFTTAYNQYAIKAFKYSSIDYLLKPINPTELKNAIDRAISDINNENEHQELLKVLKENLTNKQKKIVLKTTENRHIINIDNIIRLEADGAYTKFVTTQLSLTISKNIKHYESLLGDDFIRCHQSHLVNSQHIINLTKNDFLELSNDNLIPVSIRKKSEVIEKLR